MRKRILSIWLALCLCLSLLPTVALAAETTLIKNQDDLATAVTNAQDGDVLDLGGNSFTVNDDGSNSPWLIDKSVTLKNGTINLRAGGIVLGADVTFQDIQLSFANTTRNVIAANGYTLTLTNVSRAKNDNGSNAAQQIHLVCGTMIGKNGKVGNAAIPAPGAHGKLVISGKVDLGNLYAGNLATGSDKTESTIPATITIDPATMGTIGMERTGPFLLNDADAPQYTVKAGIYASGAVETPAPGLTFDANYEQMPPVPSVVYQNGGRVDFEAPAMSANVTLNLGNQVSFIVGNDKTTVNYTDAGNGYEFEPLFMNISALNLKQNSSSQDDKSANVKIQNGSTFAKGATLDLPAKAKLNLSALKDELGGTDHPTFASLTGGGTLVLAAEQTVTFSSSVSGTTKVAVGDVNYNGQNSTGRVTLGHTYVKAAGAAAGAFTLLPDQLCPGYVLTKDESGNWTVTNPQTTQPVKVKTLTLSNHNTTDTESTAALSAAATFEGTGSFSDLADLPMTIKVDGIAATRGTDGDYTVTVGGVALTLFFGTYDGEALYIQITEDDATLPKGSHTVSVTIPADNWAGAQGGNTISANLTVLPAGGLPSTAKPKATVTAVDKTIQVGGTLNLTAPVEGKDYTVTGLLSGDTLQGEVTLKGENLDLNKPGTYTITPVVENPNSPRQG